MTRLEIYVLERFAKMNRRDIGFRIIKEESFLHAMEFQENISEFVEIYFRSSKKEILGEEKERFLTLLQEKRSLYFVYKRFKHVIQKEHNELFHTPSSKIIPSHSSYPNIIGAVIIFLFLSLVFPYLSR